ncbi:acyltransferase family protein [Pseudolysinimonas sp.]|jgi:peptidoglycan/LPS O-acetylase OafA/YrhL|uniref:acyltransferase family protein n=1 Tax=Pseudolysinimonas sp. TaxID=2680009 RepID=UPI003784BA9A
MARPERDNDFDAIRLLAAMAVLVGHAFPLTGMPHPPFLAGLKLFDLGVYVFFSLSGFLIGSSWARSPLAIPFLLRRVFRIFPALVLLVFATTFVVGPVVTAIGAADYFADSGSWAYLGNLTLVPVYTLPGVFLENPVDAIVNGALWTLGPEFVCYLVVLAVGLLALRTVRPGTWRLVAFAGFGLTVVVVLLVPHLAPRGARDVLTVAVFFAGGAVLAELRARGRLSLLGRVPVLVALTAAWVVGGAVLPEPAAVGLAWVVLPSLVVGWGGRSTPVVRRAARFGDLSYGLYLWGFPVQQAVVLVAPGLPLAVDILLVAIIAGGLALASWWLIERRAIGFGRWAGRQFRIKRTAIGAT